MRFRIVLITVALSAAVAGCGDGRPTRVPVSGRVMIDGKPLTRGTVRFVPGNARPSSGTIDAEGRFTLSCYDGADGAVPGHHAIEISATETLGPNAMRWCVPKKYCDANTSGLSQEITGPTEDVVIELTWAGGKPIVEKFGGLEGAK